MELNFLKNRGNFLIDSGFFNEYYFKLKKQFNEHKIKKKFIKKINIEKIKKKNLEGKILSHSVNNIHEIKKEFKNEKIDDFNINIKKYQNANDSNKEIILKKINKLTYNNNLESTTARKSE